MRGFHVGTPAGFHGFELSQTVSQGSMPGTGPAAPAEANRVIFHGYPRPARGPPSEFRGGY